MFGYSQVSYCSLLEGLRVTVGAIGDVYLFRFSAAHLSGGVLHEYSSIEWWLPKTFGEGWLTDGFPLSTYFVGMSQLSTVVLFQYRAGVFRDPGV